MNVLDKKLFAVYYVLAKNILKRGEQMRVSREKIEYIMAAKGWTSAETAGKSGISRQSFSTIKLRGTCAPATAWKIARGLGVEVAEIIEREG